MVAPSHYPMSIGRIFSLGWSLFKFAWRPMLGATAVLTVPAYALMTVVATAFSPLVSGWLYAAQTAQLAGQLPPPLPDGFGPAFFALILASLVTLVASLAATAAIIHVVDSSYRGERIAIGAAVRDGLARLGSLIVANLLFLVAIFLVVFLGVTVAASIMIAGGIAVFFGLIVIVGTVAALIFFGMRTSLVAPVIVVDRAGGADGLVRSWRLTSGSGWRVIGYLLVIGLVQLGLGLLFVGVPTLLLGLSETVSADVAVGSVVNGLAGIPLAVISPIVLTLLYYDLRWRSGEKVPVPGGGETSSQHVAPPPTTSWGPPPL